jgi:methyl-accepting chemotaxis protein
MDQDALGGIMKMRIGQKLALGYATVLAVVLGAAVFTYTSVAGVNKAKGRLVEVRFPTAMSADAARFYFDEHIELIRAAVEGSSEERRTALADLRNGSALAAFDKAMGELDIIEPRWTNPETRQNHMTTRGIVAEIRPLLDEAKRLADSDDTSDHTAAQTLLATRIDPELDRMFALLADTIENQREAIAKDTAELTSLGASLSTTVIATTAVSLFAGIAAAWWLSHGIVPPLRRVTDRARAIAEGDLSNAPLAISSRDEIGDLTDAVNAMNASLHDLVRETLGASHEVAAAATEIAASGEQMAAGMAGQERELGAVASATSELSSSAEEVSARTVEAAEAARSAGEAGRAGSSAVETAILRMQEIKESVGSTSRVILSLGERCDSIGRIVEIINDIADQTNLLALNAAIEAARAGEHGRGFAVVADEVRKLSERTTNATKEIADSIGLIRSESTAAVEQVTRGSQTVEEGVAQTAKVNENLQSIINQAGQLAQMVTSIAQASREQTGALHEVAGRIEKANAYSKESASATTINAAAATQLSTKSEHLNRLVNSFRLSSSGDAGHHGGPKAGKASGDNSSSNANTPNAAKKARKNPTVHAA